MEQKKIANFQKTVWKFYKKSGRSFPWRETQNPYHILVSEIMLQQTQAPRVVAYYNAWIKRFPGFASLAKAPFSQIYPLWQGLGYNRRALALQKLAKEVIEKYRGELPTDLALLQELPGIGPYTARAVSIFSWNRPIICIETNIRRVFIHHFFPEAEIVSDEEIIPLLEAALPVKKAREWHWALMDYGALLRSTHQGKLNNPNQRSKHYSIQPKFEGSLRQLRGAILKNLAQGPKTASQMVQELRRKEEPVKNVLLALEKEGFIAYKSNTYHLA